MQQRIFLADGDEIIRRAHEGEIGEEDRDRGQAAPVTVQQADRSPQPGEDGATCGDEQQRGQDASRPPLVEIGDREDAGRLLADNQAGDQVAADDEEDVDADEAASAPDLTPACQRMTGATAIALSPSISSATHHPNVPLRLALRRLAPDARRAVSARSVSSPTAQRHLLAGWRTRQAAGARINSHVDGCAPIAFEALRAIEAGHIVASTNPARA